MRQQDNEADRRQTDYHDDTRRVATSQQWRTDEVSERGIEIAVGGVRERHAQQAVAERLEGSIWALFDQAACGSCSCLGEAAAPRQVKQPSLSAAKGSKAINKGC